MSEEEFFINRIRLLLLTFLVFSLISSIEAVAVPVTPTIEWSDPANITAGTALDNTQLNAVAKDPVSEEIVDGSYTYDPASGTQLPVGNNQNLSVVFTPTDTATYAQASKNVTIDVIAGLEPMYPVASFTANKTEGFAPLTVQFTDNSENAGSWKWDFENDGNVDSEEQNPVHTFASAGTYEVNLTAINENGTNSKFATINVSNSPGSIPPVADFTVNTTSGFAPLTVQFNDNSENATSLTWDFENDGNVDSTERNPVHTFVSPGIYDVNLTVSNEYDTHYKIITITVQNFASVFPIADFSTSTTSGYAPLTVQFSDRSQHATGWTWTFGDGGISTERNPSHTYSTAGTYTVYLVASNGNITASKTATINVYRTSSGGSSGGSSSGGGVGGSPEPSKNVEVKEISQAYISNGNSVKFDFAKKATCVVYVSFDAKKTAGKTTTSVEMLRGKSTLVSALPSGIIYKSLNIWVGNAGFATPANIENAVICFKVEKAWIKDKKVDQTSIALYRYDDKKWNKLETGLSGEDNKYIYFTAKTPGFSPFVIKGESTVKAGNITAPKNNTQSSGENSTTPQVEEKTLTEANTGNNKIPGFETIYGITSLFVLFLYKKNN